MKILLSPAKTLDFNSPLPTDRGTQPFFKQHTERLVEVLKNLNQNEIADLMGISSKLAEVNFNRFQNFSSTFTNDNARPALYAFAGDVYSGLDAYTIDTELLDVAQDRLRILSGLYGYLRPLDLIQPYRLEMGTKLQVGDDKNLYEFWKDLLTEELNKDTALGEVVVNLASNEYFKVIQEKQLKGTLVTPIFKDYKNGKLKVIAFYAKKARGLMARYLIEQNIMDTSGILDFAMADYHYSEQETEHPNQPVFVR